VRAIVISEFGGPERLELTELPDPQPAAGEVVIDVDSAGVNFGDLLVRQGQYMGRDALPVIPGWEVTGRRTDSGERVVALLAGGGYAELVCAPQADIVALPDAIDDQVALAIVIQGATAWHLLETPVPVVAGETLLITGAGGGVTALLVQLALLRGARPVVIASSAAKAEHALALGAEAVVVGADNDDDDHSTTLAAAVRELLPDGADVLIDCVGEPLFGALMRCLRPGGRAVVYGVAGGRPASVHTGAMLKHGLTVSGLWLGHGGREPLAHTLDRLFGLYLEGRLRPLLGPVLPLEDAAQSHRLLAARTAAGKILLRVRTG